MDITVSSKDEQLEGMLNKDVNHYSMVSQAGRPSERTEELMSPEMRKKYFPNVSFLRDSKRPNENAVLIPYVRGNSAAVMSHSEVMFRVRCSVDFSATFTMSASSPLCKRGIWNLLFPEFDTGKSGNEQHALAHRIGLRAHGLPIRVGFVFIRNTENWTSLLNIHFV